jgi:hypothetical protein
MVSFELRWLLLVDLIHEVVADDAGRPVLAAPPTAETLARAKCLDAHAVGKHNAPGAPHGPAPGKLGIVPGQIAVVDQFGLEVLQVAAGMATAQTQDAHGAAPSLATCEVIVT